MKPIFEGMFAKNDEYGGRKINEDAFTLLPKGKDIEKKRLTW